MLMNRESHTFGKPSGVYPTAKGFGKALPQSAGSKKLVDARTVEDFYAKDKTNINFWLAKMEKYSKENVISSCLRSGVDRKIADEIAAEVDSYVDNRMRMSEVRPLIFAILQQKNPSAAKKFKAGEIYVRTSGQRYDRFNRERIITSLLKETKILQHDAEKIAIEVEKFIRASNLDYVSSPLLREMVNAKLIEHGFEEARSDYTRIGMPVYDITELINIGSKENANLQYNPETLHKLIADNVFKEYALMKAIPKHAADAHLHGLVHIHDLDYFVLRPFCFSHDLRYFFKKGYYADGQGIHTAAAGPAKHAEVAVLHAAKILASAQTQCFHKDEPVMIEEDGKIKIEKISEVVEKLKSGKEINSFGIFDYKLTKQPITCFNEHETDEEMFEVSLENGKAIKLLAPHPMFVFDETQFKEVLAKDLKTGNYIPVPVKLPSSKNNMEELDLVEEVGQQKNLHIHEDTFNFERSKFSLAKKIRITEKFMRLLGYYVSEGNIVWNDKTNVYDVQLSFGSHENELIEDAKDCIKSVFGFEPAISNPYSWVTQITFGGKLAAILFEKLCGRYAKNKRVPWILFNVNENMRIEFLKAYFDGDGHSHRNEIIFDTVSKRLASDLSYLLLQLGLISRIRKEKCKEREIDGRTLKETLRYRVEIQIKNLEVIERYLEGFAKYPLALQIPTNHAGLRELYSEIKPSFDVNLRAALQKERTSREKAKQMLVVLKERCKTEEQKRRIEELEKIVSGDIGFLKIKEIKKEKSEGKFYDLTTPSQTFVGCFGGVLVHNCGGGQGYNWFNIFLAPFVRGFEYKKMKQMAQMFLFEMSQMYVARGGQSLHADEIVGVVKDDELERVKIGEFVDNIIDNSDNVEKMSDMEFVRLDGNASTIAFDKDTLRAGEFPITAVSRHKPNSKMFEVKTKSGRKIRITDYHSLYTYENGKIVRKKASELGEGNFIVIPKKMNFEKNIKEINLLERLKDEENIFVEFSGERLAIKEYLKKKEKSDKKAKITVGNGRILANAIIPVNKELMRLLGYYLAEGHISSDSYVNLTTSEESIIRDFSDCLKIVFGIENIRVRSVSGKAKTYSFGGDVLKLIFEKVFCMGNNANEKKIPSFMFSLSEELCGEMLKCYFSCDGYMSKNKLEATTISESLASDLSYILLKFGIVSDIRFKPERNVRIKGIDVVARKQFRVMINSYQNKKIFYERIGFILDRKTKNLEEYLKMERKLFHHTEIFPDKKILYNFYRQNNEWVPDNIRTCKTLYRHMVLQELPKMDGEITEIQRFLESDIALDKVVSCKEIETSKYVYDFEVAPQGKHIENFIAGFGGVFTSNTVFSSINLEPSVPKTLENIPAVLPGGITNGDTYGSYEDEANQLFRAFIDVYTKGDAIGKPFNFPKCEVKVTAKDFDKHREEMDMVSALAAKFGTPYYFIQQDYMPEYACFQSLPYDEKVFVVVDDELKNIKIGEYVEGLMEKQGSEKGKGLEGEVEVSEGSGFAISFNPETLDVEKRRIGKIMRHKTKEKIFRFVLDTNRKISATAKHKVHVLRDGKIMEVRAEEIKKGDYLIGLKNIELNFAFNDEIEFKNRKLKIDNDFSRLLGYFASEGCLHLANKKNRANKICFSFHEKETEFIEDVEKILKEKFGLNPKRDVSIKNKCITVYVCDKNLTELFAFLGTGFDAHSKRVPEKILSSPREIIKEFMLGLFRGDGYFKNTDKRKIDLHLCNKELIEDVFTLSLRIGIPMDYYEGKESFSLRLTSNKRINSFLTEIPFAAFPKTDGGLVREFDFAQKTEGFLACQNAEHFVHYDRMPSLPFGISRENMKTGQWNRAQIGKRVTIDRLENGDNLHSRFAESDLHLFEVKEIEEVKSEYVYDFVDVDKYHNFANANGIFSSNCCAYLMPLSEQNTQDDLYNGTTRGGALQVVTINLPRIAYDAEGNDTKLFELLRERMKIARDVLLVKQKIIKQRMQQGVLPFLSQTVDDKGTPYLDVDKQSLELGMVGLNEMLKVHTGRELHEGDDAWKFGMKVIKTMTDIAKEFSAETGAKFVTSRTPAESCSYRLASIDLKEMNGKAVVQGDRAKKAVYYTNGNHVRPSADVPLFDRLRIEASFNPLLIGGTMSHVWMGEANPDPTALTSLTERIVKKTLMAYYAYTKDLTVCKSCKFVAPNMLKICPHCDSKDVDWYSRITGYYQKVSGWNAGKLQELQDRRRYGVSS